MKNNVEVITEKLNENEYYLVTKVIQDEEQLSLLKFFNEFNWFLIHKLYVNGFFRGYAVIFLGYNSLVSNEVSLEDIVYFGDLKEKEEIMTLFLGKIKRKKDFPITINDIYYNQNRFNDIHKILKSLDYKPIELELNKGITR